MKQLTCEMCGGTDLVKQDGMFVCQTCGVKYSVEEAKKMMIEGTVEVQGTVKVDNSVFIEKSIQNARRALNKEDWEEVEKYYNIVEQNAPYNIESVFFSSFGKAMSSLTDSDYFKREEKFKVLNRSISCINDYYEQSNENKEEVLKMISDNIVKMFQVQYVYAPNVQFSTNTGGKQWCINLLDSVRAAFVVELNQIKEKHDEAFIDELIKANETSYSKGVSGWEVAGAIFKALSR